MWKIGLAIVIVVLGAVLENACAAAVGAKECNREEANEAETEASSLDDVVGYFQGLSALRPLRRRGD